MSSSSASSSSSSGAGFVQRCCIPGCTSNYDRNSVPVQVFPLPRDPNVRKLWLRAIPPQLHHLNPVVCIKHFNKSQLLTGGSAEVVNGEISLTQKAKPRPNAVPVIVPNWSKMIAVTRGHPYARNWQGGSVVLAQGTPVNSGSLEMAPAPSITSSMVNRDAMRGPPIHPGFMPLSDQIRSRSSQFLNMYSNYPPKMMNPPGGPGSGPPPAAPLPLYPEVKFKKLPFYDVIDELIKPSILSVNPGAREPVAHYAFYLSPRQASDVAMNREVGAGTKNEYVIQVQLRFGALESTELDDQFPPGCVVKVNGKAAPLPNPVNTKQGQEPKRPPRPVNISNLAKLSPSVSNNVSVSWTQDFQKNYCLGLYLVRRLTSTDLLERLKKKGVRSSEHTTGLIKEKLSDQDNDIATTSLRVTLVCPLGKMRMQSPVRSTTCSHFQCFDGAVFLNMNEKRPTWNCPVCNKPALYDDLVIDGYFHEVLDSPLLGDSTEIQLNKDGSWSVHNEAEETVLLSSSKAHTVQSNDDQITEIKDDDDDEVSGGGPLVNGDSKQTLVAGLKESSGEGGTGGVVKPDPVVVDLTESDDESSGPPPAPAQQQPPPAAAPTAAKRPVSIIPTPPPPASAGNLEHTYSGSLAGGGASSMARSSPSIINLDSPSPSPPLSNFSISAVPPPTNFMCHMRVDSSQYHPF